VPAEAKDPRNWPAAMRAEWSDDQGTRAAAGHRERMVAGLRRARKALDEFKPDFVLIWGDDQYENFREDVIPPFCLFAYPDMTIQPWAQAKESSMMNARENVWKEPKDKAFPVRFHRDAAKHLACRLLESDFDVAYAYRPLHHGGLPHAYLNAILYLDYDRHGFDYPVVPMQVNCYGEIVVSHKGFLGNFADRDRPRDPPSPSPRRCFDLGAQVARICRESPYRVALVASSSWSHAFLVDKTWRLMPDIEADRRLYQAMVAGDYEAWRRVPLASIGESGQQEVLNWFALMGAMNALGQRCAWSDFIETWVFNSTKVAAVFPPAG